MSELQYCGHPMSETVSSEEGTHYCAACEREAREDRPCEGQKGRGGSMKPHCCPVCNGSGRVSYPPGTSGDLMRWSSSGTENYPCTPCGGTGVLWEPALDDVPR